MSKLATTMDIYATTMDIYATTITHVHDHLLVYMI